MLFLRILIRRVPSSVVSGIERRLRRPLGIHSGSLNSTELKDRYRDVLGIVSRKSIKLRASVRSGSYSVNVILIADCHSKFFGTCQYHKGNKDE